MPADLQSNDCPTQVTLVLGDISCAEQTAWLGRNVKVDGVMHAAGILKDALFLKQTAASFKEVLAGKASLHLSSNLICNQSGYGI